MKIENPASVTRYLSIIPPSKAAPATPEHTYVLDTKYGPVSIKVSEDEETAALIFHDGIPGSDSNEWVFTNITLFLVRSALEPILKTHDFLFGGTLGPIAGSIDTSQDVGTSERSPSPMIWLVRHLQEKDLSEINSWLSSIYKKPCSLGQRIHFAFSDEGRCEEGYVVKFD